MLTPRNSCLTATKIHLVKLNEHFAASSWPSTFFVDVRCSSQVTLVSRMSSSPLATSSSGSLEACRMLRVDADGSTVRLYPDLLNFYRCSSWSRKVDLFFLRDLALVKLRRKVFCVEYVWGRSYLPVM